MAKGGINIIFLNVKEVCQLQSKLDWHKFDADSKHKLKICFGLSDPYV